MNSFLSSFAYFQGNNAFVLKKKKSQDILKLSTNMNLLRFSDLIVVRYFRLNGTGEITVKTETVSLHKNVCSEMS